MLVDSQTDALNRKIAIGVSATIALSAIAAGFYRPVLWFALPLAGLAYFLIRRQTLRRRSVIAQPFLDVWEATLQTHVAYYRNLAPERKTRFQNLVKVFLDEVDITGIRTEVDESTRALVAASAVIPIMGFEDFEYSGLGEVLIYPGSFDDNYQTEANGSANTLGMVGLNHLSGVMILSKPSLIAGFANQTDKRNVGIHEFAHLVDKQDGHIDGVPVGIDPETFDPWVKWVGEELRREVGDSEHIDDYAYTNEAEYFAVLTEYFFESPELLEQKNPKLYQMLRKMYHQDPKRVFGNRGKHGRRRVGRNSPCPCGSGEKFKKCCSRKSTIR